MKDVGLFFAAGEITFVVGKSGSGKSTITQLLAKFYQFNEGHTTLDDVTIQKIDPTWLRQNILLVEQSSVLFTGSIEENIGLGTFDISKEFTPEQL